VFQGELAHGRQLGARLKLAAGDHATNLLEDLPVDGSAGLRIQDEHDMRVM
jgi:hypothetical protein